ncbi:aldo/keto reductase subgroup [Trichococcus palustris]|uniref:Aldo/keto reductase subgroup n=2 Tax=Trichococcus palustris TaxID=140314 RepID=A0A143YDL7_9LACT|nr:aldo/keto reductase subgroup [Trichococcus palustris]SFK58601.1 Aldo/keto reductase [Trichococcus palustris]
MPLLGYGTWRNKVPEECVQGVKDALAIGFRHVDCASAYLNEELVGQGIRESGVPRGELFITSKLRNAAHGYNNVRREVEASLQRLGTDYLDLYLIHWPVVEGHGEDWDLDNAETWRAFEELYDEGLLKAIGVSNFSIPHLQNLMDHSLITPMVNQLLIHPGVLQQDTVAFCRNNGIVVEAYSPLAPLKVLAHDERVQAMAQKYGKSAAQILLRFDVQNGIVPLTKTVHKERMAENIQIFDFSIDDEDMRYLNHWQHPDFKEPDNSHERPPQIN